VLAWCPSKIKLFQLGVCAVDSNSTGMRGTDETQPPASS